LTRTFRPGFYHRVNDNNIQSGAAMKKIMSALIAAGFFTAFFAVNAVAAPINVTVSIPPQKYFVAAIGKDDVAVTVMTGKGRDPHTYEPTAAQMAGISKAEIYIAVGVPFESQWLPKFSSLAPSMHVITLQNHIERIKGEPDLALRDTSGKQTAHKHEEHAHGGHHHDHGLEGDDPHIWLSPKIMADTVPVIVKDLSGARPEKAALFAERGNKLVAETRALDAEIAAMFKGLPENRKTFLTFHQSWAYYAHNYGLHEAAVELEGREIGPKSMVLLLDFAKKNSIKVLVSDPMTSKSALAALSKSFEAEVITATPLDENWPSSMRTFSEKLAQALRK
jgi:zinc transport system substrate-binding protein